MFVYLIFSACIGFLCQNLYAAGPARFTYEVHEHEQAAVPPPLNQSLVHYDYATIRARNAAIPPMPVAGGALPQIGISLSNTAMAPGVWNHLNFPLPGAPLTIPEKSRIAAIERPLIGITVRFRHPAVVLATALGLPLPMAVAAVPPGYLPRALRAGGYNMPLERATYRLRHSIPHPGFVLLPIGAPAPIADSDVIHFHLQTKVSKNMKELSHNARVIGPPYSSIKNIIDNQLVVLGLPRPDSATVVSFDNLQPN